MAVRGAQDHLFGCTGEFDLLRCRGCGSLRVDPRPAPEALGPFYAGYYTAEGMVNAERLQVGNDGAGFNPMRKTARRRWDEILRLLGQAPFDPTRAVVVDGDPLVVVDAGCGLGGFLHHIRADPRARVLGVEQAPEAVAYAQDKLGLEVRQGHAEALPFDDESVDVVTLWHVLEHSVAPRKALAEARRVLRPGGVLAVEVPSGSSWLGALFGRYWFFLQPPTHLHLFSPRALERLLAEEGFAVAGRGFPFVPTELLGSLYYLFARPRGLHPPRKPSVAGLLLAALGVLLLEVPLLGVLRILGRSGVVRVLARKPEVPA